MKKLVLLGVVVVGALVGWNTFQTGTVGLPGLSESEEDRPLRDLEQRLDGARRQFAGAGRAAGMAGVDATADAESARIDVVRIEKEFLALKQRLPGLAQSEKARRLEESIRATKAQLEIR